MSAPPLKHLQTLHTVKQALINRLSESITVWLRLEPQLTEIPDKSGWVFESIGVVGNILVLAHELVLFHSLSII